MWPRPSWELILELRIQTLGARRQTTELPVIHTDGQATALMSPLEA